MSQPTHGPGDGLERLLGALERQAPPRVPLEAILERLEHDRRRRWVAGALGAVAALLLLALWRAPPAGPPPVHLEIRVVDAGEEPELGAPAREELLLARGDAALPEVEGP